MSHVPVIMAKFDAWDPCGLTEKVFGDEFVSISSMLGTLASITARL